MSNVPKLRFSNFTTGWESEELGDVTRWASGGTPSKAQPEYWNGDIPWISASSMRGHYFSDSENKVTTRAIGNGTRLVPEKTILLLVRGSMLYNAIPVGMTTKPVTFNQDVKAITFQKTIDGQFGLQWFLQSEHRLLNMVSGTGIGAGKLDTADLHQMSISYPSKPEQQKIAAFLTAVDTKIEQLTQKAALLKQYKKGVMQKIFSQEIRFKADDGSEFPEWTEHKFHDVYKFMPTNSLSRADLNDDSGVYRNIHYGDIHTKYPAVLDVTSAHIPFVSDTEKVFPEYVVCRSGDLVMADASEDYADIGKSVEVVNIENELVVAGLHTILARPEKNMAQGFSAYMVQSYAFRKQIYRIAQGAKVLGIPSGQLKKLLVRFPCYEEQLKIAESLLMLDKKIAKLHEQTNIAKTFKKGLLQQMFV